MFLFRNFEKQYNRITRKEVIMGNQILERERVRLAFYRDRLVIN